MNVDHGTCEAIFDSDGGLFMNPCLFVYDLLNRLINHLCKLAVFFGFHSPSPIHIFIENYIN